MISDSTYNILLKTDSWLEKEYTPVAVKIVKELISRLTNEKSENRYMTMSEFLSYMNGLVRFSEKDFNAFQALVSRIAVEHGYILVLLPVIDIDRIIAESSVSLNNTLYFSDLVYRVSPIYPPELDYGK